MNVWYGKVEPDFRRNGAGTALYFLFAPSTKQVVLYNQTKQNARGHLQNGNSFANLADGSFTTLN